MESEIQIDTNPPPKPIQADTPPAPVLPASESDASIDTSPSTPNTNVDAKGGEVEPPKAIEVPIKTIDEDVGKKIVELQKKQQGRDVSDEPDAKIIYDDQESDPTLSAIKKSALDTATQKANMAFDETASFNPDIVGNSFDALLAKELQKLEDPAMDQFIIDYPEKAEQYKNDPAIRGALERKLHSEAQKDQETLRLLGYSEEEIQAEFEKHPYLLSNEKITFLMLKNLRDSKDLPEELKTSLLETYNDKLQHIFLRKINEARADDEKVTIDQIKDADMRSLLASLEADPEMADKTAQLLQMIEGVIAEKSKSEKEGFFEKYWRGAKEVARSEVEKIIEKYQKEGIFDLSAFVKFLIEGGGSSLKHGGAESENKSEGYESLLGIGEIKDFTRDQPDAEKNLLITGLVGAGYVEEANLYARMSAEDAFKEESFQRLLYKVVDQKETEFTLAITKTLKNDDKKYGLSAEAFTYLLSIPKLRKKE